jgi:uncharacterized protein YoxC
VIYVGIGILFLALAVALGVFLYRKHGDHIETVIDKVEKTVEDLKK